MSTSLVWLAYESEPARRLRGRTPRPPAVTRPPMRNRSLRSAPVRASRTVRTRARRTTNGERSKVRAEFWLVMLLLTQSRPATQFWFVAFCWLPVPAALCELLCVLLTLPLFEPSPLPEVPPWLWPSAIVGTASAITRPTTIAPKNDRLLSIDFPPSLG